ncbi:potassium channel family protein [Streptomyces sp. NRRL B-1347]|uniref:potassium channel family protein n=1 Tax=Streptomyces sp. NRRL B-1347 TaxID=1476877 RepID=UPI00068E0445|nr:potassium channel family protein [Streptomyces sp. NRRL B-1347]
MLPGFLTRAVALLLGREGREGREGHEGRGDRSLHLKAAGGATVVLAVTMAVGSWAVVAAEHGARNANLTTYPKALWWSIETATTVGYGDFYPVTLWGRVVGAVVMGVGITTYGVMTAALATWFVGREQRRHHLVRSAEREARALRDDTARALHERFDRLERMLTAQGVDDERDAEDDTTRDTTRDI